MPAKGWIEVDPHYCKGCELCVFACPQDVLGMDKGHLTSRGYHPAYLKRKAAQDAQSALSFALKSQLRYTEKNP